MIIYHPNHSHLSSSLSTTQSVADTTMTHDEETETETDQNPMSEQILEWLGGSLPYMPSIFDDPYGSNDFDSDSLWILGQNPDHHEQNNNSTTTSATSTALVVEPITLQPSDSCKKRKASTADVVITSKTSRKSQVDDGETLVVEQAVPARRTAGRKNYAGKTAAGNCNNGGNNKEGRWAEQLLNPCAAAITASNPSRVQHLLYVINELASLTGDANHRLAAHGLRALTHHLSSPGSSASTGGTTFASTNPKFFTVSLLNFNDVNPWFRIPNSIANSSILQILAEQDQSKNLHIVDIGVSHGIQWPTLLEELSRQSGGPPPLVRITVLTQTIEDEQSRNTPFAVSPSGYNCSSQLLSFAKAININLQINKLDNFPLQNLNSRVIKSTPDETLIICTQFRLHNLKHNNPDDRTQFLKVLRSMQPSGVILSENNADCSCNNCVDFATGFSRSVEYLWRFLDSTSVAYKGRESDERRMMEGEAAKALTNVGEMNERKEKWCERMMSVGFTKKVFGDDAIDGARALLRKYDNNWEVRVEDKDGCIGLWWKGQPISFCSLWKPEPESSKSLKTQSQN